MASDAAREREEHPLIVLTVGDDGVARLLSDNLRPVPGDEMMLRLADVAQLLHEAQERNDDDGPALHVPSLLSALDHAVRGSQGCLEDDAFRERRFTALMTHAGFLLGVH